MVSERDRLLHAMQELTETVHNMEMGLNQVSMGGLSTGEGATPLVVGRQIPLPPPPLPRGPPANS